MGSMAHIVTHTLTYTHKTHQFNSPILFMLKTVSCTSYSVMH